MLNRKRPLILGVSFITIILAVLVITEQTNSKQTINWINGEVASISFEDIVKKADIIAHVNVKKLEEVIPDGSMEGTKFLLKVNRYYKNRTVNSGEIFVYQAGSPESQFKQNPLLEEGKEYILFLQEIDSPYGKALIMIQEGYGRYNFIDGDKVQRQLPLEIKNEPIPYGEFVERIKQALLR